MGNIDPFIVTADTLLRMVVLEGVEAAIWGGVFFVFYLVAEKLTR